MNLHLEARCSEQRSNEEVESFERGRSNKQLSSFADIVSLVFHIAPRLSKQKPKEFRFREAQRR